VEKELSQAMEMRPGNDAAASSFAQPGRKEVHVISTSRLTKAFDTLVAVNDLHLEVLRGDVFGFLGPNGSGKTTTIRMLLGLIRPTAGNISLFGLDNATHLAEILPRVGAIVETPVFYPYLSGVDNLRIVAAASGMQLGRANQARIDEVLELVDLSARGGDAYRKYSLGMKQRLAIGAALLTDPELILLDLLMPKMDGITAVREIKRVAPSVQIIILTSYFEDDQIFSVIKAGALSYLLKDTRSQELVAAVRAAARGESVLHPQVAARILREMQQPSQVPLNDLTPRELEVIARIAHGRSNHEIALELVISEPTVRTHVANILSKLHLTDRTQAAIYALQQKLVPLKEALDKEEEMI